MDFREKLSSLDGEYEIRETEFSDSIFSDEARHLIFSDVTFTRCRFTESDFIGCEFSCCRFISCDFSGTRFDDTFFSRVSLSSVKAVGANFSRSVWRDADLHGCVLLMANFSGAKWDHLRVRETNFREASLSGIQLRVCEMEECDLTRAEVFRTKFAGMDLRSCRLDKIVLSDAMAELRGAIIDSTQAAELVRGMGVTVK